MPEPDGLDAKQLAQNLGMDDPDFMEDVWDIVDTYIEDTETRLPILEQNITALDHEKVRQEAHTLKGSSGSICALHMREIAAQLETDATQQSHARYMELLQDMKAAFDLVKADVTRQKTL